MINLGVFEVNQDINLVQLIGVIFCQADKRGSILTFGWDGLSRCDITYFIIGSS